MQHILCRFPRHNVPRDLENPDRLTEVFVKLRHGLRDRVTPASLGSNTVSVSLALPDDLARELNQRAGELGTSVGMLVGGLLAAAGNAAPAPGDIASGPVVSGLRTGQAAVVEAVAPTLAAGQFALIEAGTGSGKSRMIAHLAAYVLRLRDAGHPFVQTPLTLDEQLTKPFVPSSPAGRAVEAWLQRAAEHPPGDGARAVLMAAPTLANVMHLALEYARVVPAVDPAGKWKFGVVLGRRQFVSPSAIQVLLAAQAVPDAAVQAWLDAGCPAGSSETTAHLKRLYPDICGLTEDLREIAADFPVDDALLSPTCSDDEQAWYFALREIARGCDLVAVTHAMLALDNRSIHQDRTTVLPRALALFIDEAHLFEEAQADSASVSLSMTLLKATLRSPAWAGLRAVTAAGQALSAADKAYGALRAVPAPLRLPAGLAEAKAARMWDHAHHCLVDLQAALKTLMTGAQKRSAPGNGAREVAEVEQALRAISAVLRGAPGSLSFSQTARYPQLSVGPSTVAGPLATRWESTPCGALLSGTLLYPGAAGRRAEPVIRRMALPPHRTPRPVEIHPHWIRSTPTLLTPPSEAKGLTPPAAPASEADLRAWLQQVSKVVVEQVAPSAAGGTLVLLTGYERLGLLEAELTACPELARRVIAQQQGLLPMPQAMAEFRRRAYAGDRPIWLALGGAWTGIDLRDGRFADDEADRDLLLTDVVIPAIPFGLNRTTTHEARVNFSGFHAHKAEALNTFCQGLGRLVRREGLIGRRLWVLDGRLNAPGLTEFNKVLSEYPKRRRFELGMPPAPAAFTEGAMRAGQESGFERSPAARKACLAHYGFTCCACGFDFEKVYGTLGAGFIHVHHLTPLAHMRESHQVDPLKDLRPVCPSCHAMLHRTDPPCSIEALRAVLKAQTSKSTKQLQPLYC